MRAAFALLALVALGGCASLPMAPAMSFQHKGKVYCVSYIKAMQIEAEPQLLLSKGQCPVILEE